MVRKFQCDFPFDPSCLVECQDGLIHGHHSLCTASGNGVVNLMGFIVPNHIPHCGIDMHNLISRNQASRCIRQELLELPAGKLDAGEDHRPAAIRELSEETGLEAGELTYLGCLLASPGFCTERLHMYLARDLRKKESHPDEDEFLNVITMPFQQLLEQVMDGTVEDAKTVATVLKTKVLLGL